MRVLRELYALLVWIKAVFCVALLYIQVGFGVKCVVLRPIVDESLVKVALLLTDLSVDKLDIKPFRIQYCIGSIFILKFVMISIQCFLQ